MLTLISATPSPYARKNRIALLEKSIPFTLQTEIPWHSTTITPKYNPLEKLPILLFPDNSHPPIYESWFIQEFIVTKYAHIGPRLMPPASDIDAVLETRRIQILADGACDAIALVFFEVARGPEKISAEWMARQLRKVNGVLKSLDALVVKMRGKGEGFLVGDEFGVADIAVGCMLGMMEMVEREFGIVRWCEEFPELRGYWEKLEERESFRETRPVMFELTEKVA
jgi:glutathione S-transferase